MKETWKQVIGYKGIYSISNYGRVRRDLNSSGTKNGYILSIRQNYNGYTYVMLSYKSKVNKKYIHRMVAESFIGKPNGLDVNHKNSNRSDNTLSNLEYLSRSDNLLHGSKYGFVKKGEDNNLSRFKEKDIVEIRRLYKNKHSIKEIANVYSKKSETIRRIVNKTSWRHIQ